MTQIIDMPSPNQTLMCIASGIIFYSITDDYVCFYTYGPLERFTDCVDVGRFICDGNEASQVVEYPNHRHVDYHIALICWVNVRDQQIC
jgi:hypothetical protein